MRKVLLIVISLSLALTTLCLGHPRHIRDTNYVAAANLRRGVPPLISHVPFPTATSHPPAPKTPAYPTVLLHLQGHAQQFPLSCESRAAVDAAAYWGVYIPESEFFNHLPKTDNPHTGFVGDVYGELGRLPPEGYGVYAEPIAALLQAYGLAAEPRYGLGLEGLRAELDAGHPVIIWATPRMATQPVETYTASDGQTVAVIRYEHTVTAVGYTPYAVYVVDPSSGYRWAYSNRALLTAWDKLGEMSVVVYGKAGNAASPPPSAGVPQATIIFENPPNGGQVHAPLDVRGTVASAEFDHYEIWVAPGSDPSTWQWVSGPHKSPTHSGLLTPARLEWLTPGVYTLRVVVYDRAAGVSEGRVTFQVVP